MVCINVFNVVLLQVKQTSSGKVFKNCCIKIGFEGIELGIDIYSLAANFFILTFFIAKSYTHTCTHNEAKNNNKMITSLMSTFKNCNNF